MTNHTWTHYDPIDQSHRYGRPQACREPAGSYDKTTRTAICFEHKTQYLLIRAQYTRTVVFWHISNIPPMISQSQISCNIPTFYIAAIFVKYCYTTGSWLLSGCYPLGEKLLWNRSIHWHIYTSLSFNELSDLKMNVIALLTLQPLIAAQFHLISLNQLGEFLLMWCHLGINNTLRQRQNGCHFAYNIIFKCVLSNENVWTLIKISLKFVPKGLINNIPALV